jgi:hypothetical protein
MALKKIGKFNNDAKLPTVATAQAKPATVNAAPKVVTKKAATKVAATKTDAADAMVTLRMPEGTEELERWVRTPHLPGHKFKHWFDKTKPGIKVAVDKKGILVTLPRSEAAHRGMLDYAEGAKQ